jgi:RNA polymerase sigma-70 factor (ECF subfamily)
LIARLGDARDSSAWAEFVEIYAPLIFGWARRRGLQDADAADLTQDVLRSVSTAASRLVYDPARGSFRGWLFTIVRNKLRDQRSAVARDATVGGDNMQAMLEAHPAPADLEALWDREHQERLFNWAAEQVRGEFSEATWQAFWRTAVDNEEPSTVARNLGLSVGAVYIAKSRVLARLRDRVREIQGE